MDERFDNVVTKMPLLLSQLLATVALTRANLKEVPERGIYVFYDRGTPIYVGRSNRLRQRLLEHGRPSSRHNSATFAFNLAIDAAHHSRIDVEGKTRTELENDISFANEYTEQKKRVAAMQVRVVEVNDAIEQTLFEVYAALALRTPHNDFETH